MNVIENAEYSWIFLKHLDRYYLDVFCGQSFAIYSWLVELDESESRKYETDGTRFLNELADEIRYSTPGILETSSTYKKRKIVGEIAEVVSETIKKWRTTK
jgi:hypothetical protein